MTDATRPWRILTVQSILPASDPLTCSVAGCRNEIRSINMDVGGGGGDFWSVIAHEYGVQVVTQRNGVSRLLQWLTVVAFINPVCRSARK